MPTLITYDAFARTGDDGGIPQHILDKLDDVRLKGQEAVEICSRAGVKLGFGTDLLGEMHSLQLEELMMRGAVQTPYECSKAQHLLMPKSCSNLEILDVSRQELSQTY